MKGLTHFRERMRSITLPLAAQSTSGVERAIDHALTSTIPGHAEKRRHPDEGRGLTLLAGGVLAVLATLIWSTGAEAEISAGTVDTVKIAFRDAVDGMAKKLAGIARNLLMSLLLIEMVWTLGRAVMASADFGKLLGVFFRRIVIVGLFLLLIDGIPTAEGNIGIASFILISGEALTEVVEPGASLSPADMFGQMLEIGAAIYDNSSAAGALGAVIVWALLAILGAVIAGLMLVAYIEIYVVFTVGILALGFGAWRVTEAFARNFLFSAVGKIFKLFTLLLMAVVIKLQLANFGPLTGFGDGMTAIGVVMVFTMLMSTIPASVEMMISGAPGASVDGSAQSMITAPGRVVARTGARKGGQGAKRAARAGFKAGGRALSAAISAIKGRP